MQAKEKIVWYFLFALLTSSFDANADRRLSALFTERSKLPPLYWYSIFFPAKNQPLLITFSFFFSLWQYKISSGNKHFYERRNMIFLNILMLHVKTNAKRSPLPTDITKELVDSFDCLAYFRLSQKSWTPLKFQAPYWSFFSNTKN